MTGGEEILVGLTRSENRPEMVDCAEIKDLRKALIKMTKRRIKAQMKNRIQTVKDATDQTKPFASMLDRVAEIVSNGWLRVTIQGIGISFNGRTGNREEPNAAVEDGQGPVCQTVSRPTGHLDHAILVKRSVRVRSRE